jgi:hypothetical protein
MRTTDDDRIRAYVSNRETIPGDKEDFVTDLMEDLDVPTESKLNLMGANEIESKLIREMENMRDEARAMTEINMAEQSQVSGIMDAFKRLIDDGEDPVEATKFLQDALKRTTTKQKDGGRVHAAFGKFIGEGIMQAAKLANKGIKPFGQKQTYKQKMDIRGVSNDQFNEILKKQLNRVPDEVSDEATGRGLYQSLLEAEAIITGQKLGLLNPGQRKRIAESMTEKVKNQIYENPVPGLNNDYLEYMDDAIGRMDAILEIEKLGGDLTPKPIYDGNEIIAAGIDFSQLDKLGKNTDNVIPFKPREKKFKGGIAGLLRRLNPQLEKDMVKTGPFQTGHRADMLGDMQQIKNRARDEKSGLEVFDEMEEMIIDSPRYNEAAKGAFMKLIDYEKFRAMLLDDNIKLQNMMEIDPEGTEGFIQMLYRREGSQSSMFATGGIVNTLAAPETTVAQRNAMTNEDLFSKMNSPYAQQAQQAAQSPLAQAYFSSPAFEQAMQKQQDFQARQNEAQQAFRMQEMQAQQGLADTYAGMQDFQGIGMQLDQQINQLGRGLMQGQQQIFQALQANPNQSQTGLQTQNVLNLNGLGNLFGTRSSYGN